MKQQKKDMKAMLASSLKEEANNSSDDQRFSRADAFFEQSVPSAPPQPPPVVSVVKRDTFTFPEGDYELIAKIKQRCMSLELGANKSEVVRAALHLLAEAPDTDLQRVICELERIKTGRKSK